MTQRRIHVYEYPYFVTFNTRMGLRLFEDAEYAELMGRIMVKTCAMKKFDVLSYQIMPDHIHLLVFKTHRAHPAEGAIGDKLSIAGTAARALRGEFTISDLMHGIKSYFATEIRKRFDINYSVLQPRFYTRFIDTDEYLHTAIKYIRYNPIEAGLSAKYQRMPYQYVAQ